MSDEERLRRVLQEIADDCPCTCHEGYWTRSLVDPSCLADIAGDAAREALGQHIQCKGRLMPRTEAQKRMAKQMRVILEKTHGQG